jgi:phosphoglycerate dehydrogenase-like enzyme
MRRTLVIAARFDPMLAERARADYRVIEAPVATEDELADVIGDAEILVTRTYNRVTRRVIEAAPRLEVIAQATSGIDNIDVSAAAERGIAILNMPGINADAVAELVIGFIISLTRTIPLYTRELQSGDWSRDDCASRHEMRHYRLGIVGLGNVGTRVARLGAAFGMRASACDPYIERDAFARRGASRCESLDELLMTSEIVSLHVPLSDDTRRMIGREQIAAMPRGSFLINAARGEVLDQQAALDALKENHLAGLALDVFDPEPPAQPLPDDPRLIATPHIGGCSHECRSELGAKLFDAIAAFYATRLPSR